MKPITTHGIERSNICFNKYPTIIIAMIQRSMFKKVIILTGQLIITG